MRIISSGFLQILPGQTSSGLVVEETGQVGVFPGATIVDMTVSAGVGLVTMQGTATSTTIDSGGLYSVIGGVYSGVTGGVDSGSTQWRHGVCRR
jgi:hypothetical protein